MSDKSLRKQLQQLIESGEAHVTFDAAVKGFPPALQGKKPDGADHSAWELLEHIRIAQWDILEFTRDAKHVSPEWPSGYWPSSPEPPDKNAWNNSVKKYVADREALSKLIGDESIDLLAPLDRAGDKTALREILLVADHTSYHLGQLVAVRKALEKASI